MAHRAALASGGGTVAFLAGGVDRFYPSGHDSLLRRIEASGVVASELPCGASPTRWRFLQRNRLIAAASRATVVIEAGNRSGSLNTAGHAAAIGRPLGAVPGPVTSAASAGCHRLIREYDAICVTSADEMAELVVGPSDDRLALPSSAPYDAERVRVLDALSSRARSIDDIARLSGLSVATVQSMLGLLELEGIASVGDSGWRRA
jgi:DNA processing protein